MVLVGTPEKMGILQRVNKNGHEEAKNDSWIWISAFSNLDGSWD